MSQESTIFRYETKIREQHLDTFAHVNNAVYLQLFEEARWEMLSLNNHSLKNIHEEGIGPVILEAHLVFKSELTNREDITIETQFDGRANPKIFRVKQQIVKKSGQIAATLQLTLAVMDLHKRKLIDTPPHWLTGVGSKEP